MAPAVLLGSPSALLCGAAAPATLPKNLTSTLCGAAAPAAVPENLASTLCGQRHPLRYLKTWSNYRGAMAFTTLFKIFELFKMKMLAKESKMGLGGYIYAMRVRVHILF